MIVHVKQECNLLEKETSRRYFFIQGEHSLEQSLADNLMKQYPEMFEEKYTPDLPPMTPQSITTQQVTAPQTGFVCDVCGKEVSTLLALAGHKRTHNKGITLSDINGIRK